MELVIYAPQEGDYIKEITFNNEELKKELALKLKKYEGLVYTEDSITAAKKDRANLNKFKEAIENKRKEVKKACLAPYESFEAKIKEIVAMIDKPILAIDTQVKTYEQIKKDEKLIAIKQFYSDKVADLADLVPFDKINNPRWLNATYKESDIYKEITDLFIKVESDLKVISELQSEYELQVKDAYLKSFDLTAALQEKKRLEEQAARLAAYNRQQEEKKQQEQQNQSAPPTPSRPTQPEAPTRPPQLITVDFRVECTEQQLAALKQFLTANNIKYGRVPK